MSAASVLVVQHEDACPPGHLASWARLAGVQLDVRRCHTGEALPATLSEHAGLILLGGEMGAYDDADYPWLTDAKRLVVQALETSVPLLGICLGHQLAAVALGGRVTPRPAEPVRGLLPVGVLADAADDVLVGRLEATARVLHWNSDTVAAVPVGSTVVARDPDGEVQVMRFGPLAWGLQGHPEADVSIVTSWGLAEGSAQSQSGSDANVRDGASDAGTGSTPPLVDPAAVVAELAAAQTELLRSWAPVATRFFATMTAAGAESVTR